jgi:hypothetical protein
MEVFVKIRAGYDIAFQCSYAVPMVLMLTTHPSRDGDILSDQSMHFSLGVDARDFFDPYGNICTRLVAPPGLLEVRSEFVVEDSGLPDEVCPAAQQWDVGSLPGEALPFLLPSRFAAPKSSPTWRGRSLVVSKAAGTAQKLFATTLMTALNSAIITREAIVPLRRDTRSAAASAGTSLISQLRFRGA